MDAQAAGLIATSALIAYVGEGSLREQKRGER
jgi:hypothetical protein